MESIYTELALYGTKNEGARTDNVFSPISEVCNRTVSLMNCCFTFGGSNADYMVKMGPKTLNRYRSISKKLIRPWQLKI